MEVAWGERIEDETQGLDIVGVRGLDQSLEAALVNGITTISLRGRYFTLLTWAVGEFFRTDMANNAETFDQDRFKTFLTRVEFLALACTTLDDGPGDPSGALGSVYFATEMAALRAGQPVSFPNGRTGAMLGTYFGPCRASGLMRFGDAGRPEPFMLTPRGGAIWEARNAALGNEPWRDVLWDAETITAEEVRALARHFSLKCLADAPAEAAVLREALLSPWAPAGATAAENVASSYDRFGQSIDWLRRSHAEGAPLRASGLLSDALRRAVNGEIERPVGLFWAEYEWRRRLHYALELMLSAVSDTVRDLHETTLEDVIAEWTAQPALPQRLVEWWPVAAEAHTLSGVQAVASISSRLFVDLNPPDDIAKLSPYARALAAFAILVCMTSSTTVLRADGVFRDQESPGDAALSAVEAADAEPFSETLKRVVEIVVSAHLATTFRKMGGGQKCSLRFFPEGKRLLTTNLHTGAGRSGSRLGNVIKILEDAAVPGIGALP
ncbi:MAG: hypothetical protein AB7H66_03240 [Hyphomonadaceae bacterium]